MIRSAFVAALSVMVAGPPAGGLFVRVQDSAHTLVTPNAPDPGRVGQTQTLPGGGVGVTTGGTSHYQTLGTPGGGSAVAVPNGNNTSSVISPNGRTGTTTPPR